MGKKKGEPVPSFAEAIKSARESLGWSQADVAKAAGCGNSAVADIERGDRSPSLAMAARLAAALKIRTKLSDFAENFADKIPE